MNVRSSDYVKIMLPMLKLMTATFTEDLCFFIFLKQKKKKKFVYFYTNILLVQFSLWISMCHVNQTNSQLNEWKLSPMIRFIFGVSFGVMHFSRSYFSWFSHQFLLVSAHMSLFLKIFLSFFRSTEWKKWTKNGNVQKTIHTHTHTQNGKCFLRL